MKPGFTQSFLKSQCVTEDLAEDVSIWASYLRLLLPAGQGRPFSGKFEMCQEAITTQPPVFVNPTQIQQFLNWDGTHSKDKMEDTQLILQWSTSLMWSWTCFPTEILKYVICQCGVWHGSLKVWVVRAAGFPGTKLCEGAVGLGHSLSDILSSIHATCAIPLFFVLLERFLFWSLWSFCCYLILVSGSDQGKFAGSDVTRFSVGGCLNHGHPAVVWIVVVVWCVCLWFKHWNPLASSNVVQFAVCSGTCSCDEWIESRGMITWFQLRVFCFSGLQVETLERTWSTSHPRTIQVSPNLALPWSCETWIARKRSAEWLDCESFDFIWSEKKGKAPRSTIQQDGCNSCSR